MTKACSIAPLRRRLMLEQFVDTPDQSGGFARQWQSLAAVWGSVQSLRADRVYVAERAGAQATHRILIRWRPDVAADMRLREGAKTYVVVAAHDADDRRRYLVCHCREDL